MLTKSSFDIEHIPFFLLQSSHLPYDNNNDPGSEQRQLKKNGAPRHENMRHR